MAFLKFKHAPKNELEKGGIREIVPETKEETPSKTCPKCHKKITLSALWARHNICTCGYHFRINSRERIELICDRDSFVELFTDIEPKDPIDFPGYRQKLESSMAESRENEAVVCGTASIGKQQCCVFVMESFFMMGSMGTAVGEKITRIFEYATEKKMPVVGFTVSGGARMQEGILSLMQMAKTSGAVKRHSDAGLFYLTVLTNPTTGGVTASFAMEGDIIIAEPGATVGFAGKRVIEQTTGKSLPKGFQKSEFVKEHGFIDAIVERDELKSVITNILRIHNAEM